MHPVGRLVAESSERRESPCEGGQLRREAGRRRRRDRHVTVRVRLLGEEVGEGARRRDQGQVGPPGGDGRLERRPAVADVPWKRASEGSDERKGARVFVDRLTTPRRRSLYERGRESARGRGSEARRRRVGAPSLPISIQPTEEKGSGWPSAARRAACGLVAASPSTKSIWSSASCTYGSRSSSLTEMPLTEEGEEERQRHGGETVREPD